MKKKIITVALMCLPMFAFTQFKYKTVDNDFDPAYRIVYNQDPNGTILKMENVDGVVCLYLENGIFCNKVLNVDVVYIMPNGSKENYNLNCVVSDDSELLILSYDLINSIMAEDFKKSITMKVRVNDSYCNDSYYHFSMIGSTNALKFIE